MSKFYFEIPVPLEEAVKRLPARSSLRGIELIDGKVRVEWETDDFVTPYTFPLEWDGSAKLPPSIMPAAAKARIVAAALSGQGSPSTSPPVPKPPKVGLVKKVARKLAPAS